MLESTKWASTILMHSTSVVRWLRVLDAGEVSKLHWMITVIEYLPTETTTSRHLWFRMRLTAVLVVAQSVCTTCMAVLPWWHWLVVMVHNILSRDQSTYSLNLRLMSGRQVMHISSVQKMSKHWNDVSDATECGVKLPTDFRDAVWSHEHF